MTTLIFDHSRPGRTAQAQMPQLNGAEKLCDDIPAHFLRHNKPALPEVSELQAVRHYTRLSQRNFSIDTHFYPLGSCTMKYNPRGVHRMASLDGFLQRHPYAPLTHSQGYLACVYELQEMLKDVTGMTGVSLVPMAGAQGEFAGVAMIKAYHDARGDTKRQVMLVPDTAHGTNPASAVMCGYRVEEIPTNSEGDVDLAALKAAVNENTAGIMLTNPSTAGVFDRNIIEIARIVHQAGGLLYYDGANLNAILGQVRPGDMGFDVMHLNLHKTFATPHGGGGPGSGPVACNDRLKPFLPVPNVDVDAKGHYFWLTEKQCPQTMGRLAGFMGNAGIILRAHSYARLLGCDGMRKVGEMATLNANYLFARLKQAGFEAAYPERRASHECIFTFKNQAKMYHVSAMDIAKRLLDYGIHAPTTYFPLIIPECFLIEPTETETKEAIDSLVAALIAILEEVKHNPELVKTAPHTMPVRRLDDVKAARELDIAV